MCAIMTPLHEIDWTEIFDLTTPPSGLTLINAISLYCVKQDIDPVDFIKQCDPDMIAALKAEAIKHNHVKLRT